VPIFDAPTVPTRAIAKRHRRVSHDDIRAMLRSGRCPQQRVIIAALHENLTLRYLDRSRTTLTADLLRATRAATIATMGPLGCTKRFTDYLDELIIECDWPDVYLTMGQSQNSQFVRSHLRAYGVLHTEPSRSRVPTQVQPHLEANLLLLEANRPFSAMQAALEAWQRAGHLKLVDIIDGASRL
jgi:hypothetical protein